MTYNEAKEFLPQAIYIYIGLTEEDCESIANFSYKTYVEGKLLLGTNEELVNFEGSLLRQDSISFL